MNQNIQKFKALLKAVECGSFTKAAEELAYSQSNISHMIQDLEKEWKITMLERNRGGVRLTSEGTMLMPIIRQICQDYESLEMQVDELNGLQSGCIHIGAVMSIASSWLPGIIRAFHDEFPNIEYEIIDGTYDELEQWLLEGRIDIGFLRLPIQSELDTVYLGEDQLMVIMSKKHPRAGEEVFPVAELSREPLIMHKKKIRTEITDLLKQYKIEPNIHLTVWDTEVLMSMVEAGLGISIVPGLSLLRNKHDIVAKPLDVQATRQIAVALRDQNTASPAVKKFLTYLPYRFQQ